MSLDDYSPDLDSGEWIWSWAETQSEKVSEAFKEAVKKATSGIKRTQKDEKKAKKYDFLLASFLVKIIMDKKYDSLLEIIFKTMDLWYSSNFILGILSLINTEVSNKIREISKKELVNFNYKSEEKIEFDDSKVDKNIKNRINLWIEDIIDSNIVEYSNLKTKQNLELLNKHTDEIINFTAQVFTFFLYEINMTISKNKAINISSFIIGEVKKSLSNIKIEEI